MILSSEAGALPIPIENVRAKGRLRPGSMLLVNTTQGRLVDGEELKSELAGLHPYQRWITEQRIQVTDCAPLVPNVRSTNVLTNAIAFDIPAQICTPRCAACGNG